MIQTQLPANSKFIDSLSKMMNSPPSKTSAAKIFHSSWIDSPLGAMLAIADENALYLLEFTERKKLEREIEQLKKHTNSKIIQGKTKPIHSIEKELSLYFSGKCSDFNTPIQMMGTPFQRCVWEELCRIPTGETRSYREVAEAIGKPTGSRAVAQANGSNQLAIIIPCHRVINANGKLGGYGGGIHRKEWMLNHEKMLRKRTG